MSFLCKPILKAVAFKVAKSQWRRWRLKRKAKKAGAVDGAAGVPAGELAKPGGGMPGPAPPPSRAGAANSYQARTTAGNGGAGDGHVGAAGNQALYSQAAPG